jgi:hypothetical protein
MFNQFEQLDNKKLEKNKEEAKLGDFDSFMRELLENTKETTPEEINELLMKLERHSQIPDRKVEIYTDPELETFCCGQVPSQIVNLKGEIVKDPNRKRKQYLIGAPFYFVAGKAPMNFLRGEINHELGHAKRTDFSRFKRFEKLAKSEGYDPKEILDLDNCIEDPRMERLVGGPLNENKRKQLFEKNSKMIIPSIIKGITEGKMSPTDQFKFILKLESLWNLHKQDLGDIEKPWSLNDLHPRAREEYEKIKPILEKITGDSVKPAMKVNPEVEKLIVEHIWPAYKKLIDEFPDKKNQEEQNKQKGKRGQPSEGSLPEDNPNLDPNDRKSWPPEIQKIFQRMVKQHRKKLQEESKRVKQVTEQQEARKKARDQQRHELLKMRDGFEDPMLREKYDTLKMEVAPVIQRLKKIFQRYLPKIDEPQYEYGRRGIRFDTKRYIRKIGTGHEKPLGRRMTPEKNAMVLQILVDVSGSMYDGRRINNAVKACLAISEATQDYNIAIEILANDDHNISDNERYLIKDFASSYNGKAKSNLVTMLDQFGGENEDGKAIRVALPRLRRKVQRIKSQVDRISSLMIFISDSTTERLDTKKAAEEARQFTPFEGIAITPEREISQKVKYHFGPHSVIPKSVEDFPIAMQEILQRHLSRLRSQE